MRASRSPLSAKDASRTVLAHKPHRQPNSARALHQRRPRRISQSVKSEAAVRTKDEPRLIRTVNACRNETVCTATNSSEAKAGVGRQSLRVVDNAVQRNCRVRESRRPPGACADQIRSAWGRWERSAAAITARLPVKHACDTVQHTEGVPRAISYGVVRRFSRHEGVDVGKGRLSYCKPGRTRSCNARCGGTDEYHTNHTNHRRRILSVDRCGMAL
jgi:hypothetical protein